MIIGVLTPPSFTASEGLREGFHELGYVEGQNLRLEYRWAEGPIEQYANSVSELIQLGAAVIVTYGTPAALAAQRTTATIPIVMAAIGDPVGSGVVPNLARPGGNITGFTSIVSDLEVKRLEVLKEMLPRLSRVGMLEHPDVTPRVIKHFEPWMPLTFSEGSIGGDIEKVNLSNCRRSTETITAASTNPSDPDLYIEPAGRTASPSRRRTHSAHHALLLINPHTSFFFRSEVQMMSEEGLNAYGAVTWGQFFVYQGFNDKAGWMHTTSNVDDSTSTPRRSCRRAISTSTSTATTSAR